MNQLLNYYIPSGKHSGYHSGKQKNVEIIKIFKINAPKVM